MLKLEERLTNCSSGDDSLIYHYTTLFSACKILENNSLRLSNLTNTNDPLEFSLSSSFEFACRGDIDIHKVFRELTVSKTHRENYVRMLCFCKDGFCKQEDWQNDKNQNYADNLLFKGWARSRMWAQYADNHAGVCLVFDRNAIREQFNQLQAENIAILQDKEIIYDNHLTNLEVAMSDINTSHDTLTDYSDFYLEEERLSYLFQKCEDYRDENEYRFCLINRNLQSPDESMFMNLGASLKAVICGQRFSDILKLKIPDTVEQFKIYWSYGQPRLFKLR